MIGGSRMTASEGMETKKPAQENGHGKSGRDGDTEEFSEGELAQFWEQSWSQNGDRHSAWARLGQLGSQFRSVLGIFFSARLRPIHPVPAKHLLLINRSSLY